MQIQIGKHVIGDPYPTYFIADIAANHDGDLLRVASDSLLDRELCTHRKSVTEMYHFGFMRPKSVLRLVRKLFFESSDVLPPFSPEMS